MRLRARFWKSYGVFTAASALSSLISNGLAGLIGTLLLFAGLAYVIDEFLFPWIDKEFRSESN